jgi:hypothetical protein
LIDEWDYSKHQLLVAVAIDVKEDETDFLKAYDSKGNSYLLDANVEPDVPVIVVTNNERMDSYQPVKNENGSTNLRTSGKLERVTYIKCPKLKDIESWYFGGPELRFDGVVYNTNFTAAFQAFTKMQNPTRKSASDGYTLNQGLFNWYFDDHHGPDYYIQAWEIDDSGTTHKFSVSVTAGSKESTHGSASYELIYRQEDRRLAGELIHHKSSTPKTVSDSYIEYRLSNY